MAHILKKATPHTISANGLRNPFSSRKKFTIECGECDYAYVDKPILRENMMSICPACSSMNTWSLSGWVKLYEKRNERR